MTSPVPARQPAAATVRVGDIEIGARYGDLGADPVLYCPACGEFATDAGYTLRDVIAAAQAHISYGCGGAG